MKKTTKKKMKIAFWAAFACACLALAFLPHRHVSPPTVTVKVTPAPTPLEKPPLTTHEESQHEPVITVPVIPESEKQPAAGGHPKIAIVIDDVGVDLRGSEKAIHLPAAVTLSFLPYAIRLHEQTAEARQGGHELILHMPMEPIGHEDPGPGALIVDLPMRDLQERFETALSSFVGFDGVNNHMGSKFTAYPEGMAMVMDELQQRHLFFFDSKTSAQSVGHQIAVEKGLPTVTRDVFLDDDQSEAAIRKQLDITEHIARQKGSAVAIGHPHASTMAVIPQWISEARRDGFELVPLHTLVKK